MTTETLKTTTIDHYVAMSTEDREAAYRELRASQEQDYSTQVGPRSERETRRQIARTREAATDESWPHHRASRADRMEAQLEEAQARYEDRAVLKTALAVLTGRYDGIVQRGDDALTITGRVPPPVQAAQDTRRREIGA